MHELFRGFALLIMHWIALVEVLFILLFHIFHNIFKEGELIEGKTCFKIVNSFEQMRYTRTGFTVSLAFKASCLCAFYHKKTRKRQ